MGELRTETGACKFCGQVNVFQWGKDKAITEEQAIEEGTKACNCDSAVWYKERDNKINAAKERIDSVFSDAEDDAVIRNSVSNLIPAVVDRTITKISMTSKNGIKCNVSVTNDGTIKIKRSITEAREETV